VNLYTAQFRYPGRSRIDITRGSGKAGESVVFAPSWDLLNLVLRARTPEATDADREKIWSEYQQRYTEEMRNCYRIYRDRWEALLAMPEAVLVCYCANVERCHRGLLAEMLVKLGATYLGEVKKGHELWP
jgi:uncharacterized protein YeaO (DUF488 family)